MLGGKGLPILLDLCWDDGTRDNCEEAENGAGTGDSRPRGGEMEKPHPEEHCYL